MPEVAQQAYANMLQREEVIGNYMIDPENSVGMTADMRIYMLTVIIEVHRVKNYKEETLYLAINLADRFLYSLTVLQQPSPCLIRLSFVCILMAAKLEESIQPSFNRMVRLVESEWNYGTTKGELIELDY